MTFLEVERMRQEDAVGELLSVEDLEFGIEGRVELGPISLKVGPGEAVGIVGESGAGKSLLCRALTGMLEFHGGRISAGSITYRSQRIADARQARWDTVRRQGIGFVPQASLSGLNPLRRVGAHFKEVLAKDRSHGGDWRSAAIELLESVQLRDAPAVLRRYGHELSGGMQQRVILALTLATRPKLLIADEPTTALDATVSREILRVLKRLQDDEGLGMIVVSHDLAVIQRVCGSVHVMYAGGFVEAGSTPDVIDHSRHPYTAGLLATDPSAVPFGSPLVPIPGEPPAPATWSLTRCSYADRCPYAREDCRTTVPPTEVAGDRHTVACLRWRELELRGQA